MGNKTTRRRYLASVGTASIAVLAGCSSGGSEADGPTETDPGGGLFGDTTTGRTPDASETDQQSDPSDVGEEGTPAPGQRTDSPLADVGGAPQFQYDPANTGYAADERDLLDEGRGHPGVAWTFEVDGELSGAPAVVDGTAYVSGTDLYAVNTVDGSEAWRFEPSGLVLGTPAVADGTVYVRGSDRTVYAVDAADGTKQWSVGDGAGARSNSLTLADGTVYVGHNAGEVVAVDAASGTEEWRVATEESLETTPAVAGETVVVGDDAGVVTARDAGSGEERWRVETGESIKGSPAIDVDSGTVFVPSWDDTLYALDLSDGSEVWAHEKTSESSNSPAVADGRVYLTTEGDVTVFDATDGTVLWEYDHPKDNTAPVVTDDILYRAEKLGGGEVTAVRTAGDDPGTLWTVSRATALYHPVVVDGVVFATGSYGRLHAVISGQ